MTLTPVRGVTDRAELVRFARLPQQRGEADATPGKGAKENRGDGVGGLTFCAGAGGDGKATA